MAEGDKAIVLRRLFELGTDSVELDWQPFREGIDIYPIYESQQGCSAALLRYAPGATVPAHTHTGYEHILVLEGEQQDENGLYEQGTLMISTPGTSHTIFSPAGCIVLAIWEKPVNFH
ncbi:MAG: cupin domain-containing protein [Gammaproteobacteria bacterium]|jgi:predicted ChrR family anti-sigma factor